MKKTILLIAFATTLFSSMVEVKRGDVVSQINGKKELLSKGETIILNKNDEICIVDGKGKLVINNEIQITMNSRNKCYKNLDGTDKKSESISATAQSYLDSSEDSVSGMTRGVEVDDSNK